MCTRKPEVPGLISGVGILGLAVLAFFIALNWQFLIFVVSIFMSAGLTTEVFLSLMRTDECGDLK